MERPTADSEPDRHDLTATVTRAPDDAVGSAVALGDRWRLEKLAGQGGQAEVWRAYDRLLGQTVALKVFGAEMSAPQRERLRREVMLGRDLRHPHLIRVLEPAEVGGRLAVVMEWLPGGSLQREVEGGPVAVERVLEVAGQALEALAFLHGRRVVHRDVKPSNLLLDGEGRVRLADLGLARSLEGGVTVTRTATALGTPAYMSPEQLRGDEPSPASDLYSLGVTLWVLLTGRHPFTASSEFDLADAHLNRRPPDVRRSRPDCPRWLARFVSRLLEKKARDRFADAAAALTALRRRHAPASPRRRRRLAAAVAGVFALTVVAGAWVVSRDHGPARVEADGADVSVFDGAGRRLWRTRLEGAARDAGLVDVVGDPALEVVAVVQSRREAEATDLMVVLDGGGAVVESWPAATVAGWPVHSRVTSEQQVRRWVTADLDGDGGSELVWIGFHPRWRPSRLIAAGRALGGEAWPLLDSPGHLVDVTPWDADGDGDDELLALAYNNALGFQAALALVDLRLGDALGGVLTAQAPDPAPGRLQLPSPEQDPLRFYTLLFENLSFGGRVEVRPDHLEVVASDGRRIVLDHAGNPLDSPLHGSDGSERRALWREVDALVRDLSVDASDGLSRARRTLSEHRSVLAEGPMASGVTVMLATGLAQGGAVEDGVRLVDQELERLPGSTVLAARRARLAWLAGRHDEAHRGWVQLLGAPGLGSPALYDTLADGLRAAAFEGRPDRAFRLFEITERRLISWGGDSRRAVASLGAFFAGKWQHPALDAVVGVDQLPELEAVRAWALLERGADPAAVERQAAELESRRLAPDMARLLRARALLASGRPERALGFAEATLADLRPAARVHIEAAILVPVAEWLVGRCHQALGGPEQAAEHLARAHALGPGTVFGRPAS